MARTPTALLSPADRLRRRGLRRMKTIAGTALAVLAVVFAFSFVGETRMPALAYVRAAAEGGMVGALADWFAVTALFRRPLGLPIPHTAIIPTRKDEIGRTLGEFVETNFLSADALRARLADARLAHRLGGWLRRPENTRRIVEEASTAASALLRALSDADVQEVLENLARRTVVDPPWGPPLGDWLERVVRSGAHHGAVDLAADSLAAWLVERRDAFAGLVSRRMPAWVPRIAHRLVDDAVYREAVKFVDAVRADPRHPARLAVDAYLGRLARRLRDDPALRARFENAKGAVFDSPRVRELAAHAWQSAKAGLLAALADPESGLRSRAEDAAVDAGIRLQTDDDLARRVDRRVTDTAAALVERYRHDIASIITDTVERWDAAETTEKIELMVGRDLQYIRLNGTVVGAIAGVAIYTVAQLLLG